ncbi:coiled-coil domain-containing protein 177 [Phlebotomus argentipes]|uniref:coiled-coil domain-containing protein 177 n=1 Tax=Phlebotomus argentipes TaxID=94469 RepID=UPI002892F0C3|nr:coiled-coil domain-containing protein 177 [Phlebotomus argentipes]
MLTNLRKKIKKLGKSRSVSPFVPPPRPFCSREIHEPQYECCFEDGAAFLEELPLETTKVRKAGESFFFWNLCDKLESARITENNQGIGRMYEKLPEHDKKILNRMARKRTEESLMAEDAEIAHKYWDEEKRARRTMLEQHQEQLNRVVRENRERETRETEDRLACLESREKYQREKLKRELWDKNQRLSHRLKCLQMKREVRQCDKRRDQMRRLQVAAINQQEQDLDNQIRQQILYDQLEVKIARAECLRRRILGVQKSRIQADNELQQRIHAIKYQEVQRLNQFRHQKLLLHVKETDRRAEQIRETKKRDLEESRHVAESSRTLRDFIRRSLSPEVFRAMNCRSVASERCVSNLSFQSHVKLG